jgi:hypothetical protein
MLRGYVYFQSSQAPWYFERVDVMANPSIPERIFSSGDCPKCMFDGPVDGTSIPLEVELEKPAFLYNKTEQFDEIKVKISMNNLLFSNYEELNGARFEISFTVEEENYKVPGTTFQALSVSNIPDEYGHNPLNQSGFFTQVSDRTTALKVSFQHHELQFLKKYSF